VTEKVLALLIPIVWAAGLAAAWIKSVDNSRLSVGLHANFKTVVTMPFLYLLRDSPLRGTVQPVISVIQVKQAQLSGGVSRPEETWLFTASALRDGYGALFGGAVLAAARGDGSLLFVGGLLAILIPAARIRDVFRKVEKRKQDILLELPELLSKLMLLVGAGDTVQSALYRCAMGGAEIQPDHPLYIELQRSMNAMSNGESIHHSLELLSRRCAVQEVSVFTATLLLNYRKGGETFVLSLRELSYSLWEKRKAVARIRGEEASSKLVFPLVAMFFVLMVLVASPAFFLMS
jgi:tight adherence protein C